MSVSADEEADREALAVHLHSVRVDDFAKALEVVHTGAVEELHVHAIQAVQLLVLVVVHALPRKSRLFRIPPTVPEHLNLHSAYTLL